MWKVCSWKIETNDLPKDQAKQDNTKSNYQLHKQKDETKLKKLKSLTRTHNDKMYKIDLNFKVKK